MAASTALFVAGAGAVTHIFSESRRLACSESRFFRAHSKQSGSSWFSAHHLTHGKCLCKLPRTKKLKFKRCFAVREDSDDSFLSNVEDTDEMFDDLFDKYGKVVYTRNDQKSPSAEVDDDAESLSFAVAMARIASDVKAGDIRVLFVKPLVYWTRFFIIATAFSRPQIDAIASRIRDFAENKYGKVASGDVKPNSWTLLDFGDVVIHIFLPEQRGFYNLEEFYANATSIELPFENQPPYRN
ncbi:protein Iojap, chloroplastic [Euphorbia lathyris]|uniref:protein Iojap, chloroplastic n=1 Tax=Euphorbia lathyris TaxID=212925 RepID=UPI003313D491